jgi:hypothetical protein
MGVTNVTNIIKQYTRERFWMMDDGREHFSRTLIQTESNNQILQHVYHMCTEYVGI